MVYLLESMDFYVMSAAKLGLKVVRAEEPNQYFRHNIDVLKAKCYQFHKINSDEDNDNEELEEIDMFSEKEVIYKIYCKGQYKYYLYER